MNPRARTDVQPFCFKRSAEDTDVASLSEDELVRLVQVDSQLRNAVSEKVQGHQPPPVVVASGRGTLMDKFLAVLHVLRLEGGHENLPSVLGEVAAVTTDMGVEFGLTAIAPLSLRVLYPWHGEADHDRGHPEDDLLAAQDRDQVSFSKALPVAGVLHVLHNTASELEGCVPWLSATIDVLSAVCTLLRRPELKRRLLATCFTGTDLLEAFAVNIDKFSAKVHRKRWGSVAFAAQSLVEIRHALQYGWSLHKYRAGQGEGEGQDEGVKLPVIDEALSSQQFWASLESINIIFGAFRAALEWAEGLASLPYSAVPYQTRPPDRVLT